MRLTVTGGSGDVGSSLVPLLEAAGHQVQAYRKGVEAGADRLLHLAAKSPPATASEIVRSNIDFLAEIIEHCVTNGIKELVFFSSVSVYGTQDREGVSEETPLVAPGLYGASKLMGEELLRNAPLKVICLRLPAVLGMRNLSNFFSRSFARLAAGEPVTLQNADRTFNNFVTPEALCCFLDRLELREPFDVVNLAAAKNLTLCDITRLMRDRMGSLSEIRVDPRPGNFFNIDTERAERRYGYTPCDPQESITRWINQRSHRESSQL